MKPFYLYLCITIKKTNIMKTYTKTEIIKRLKKVFTNPQFYVTKNGDLTMSLDGHFVDHKWNKGDFINK